MNKMVICKLLGIIDIASAVLLIIFVPSVLKYVLAVPLIIKGASSLLG